MGSPPPNGSKKVVLRLRSVSSIVIAPAKTGNESSSKIAVINTDQTKRDTRSIYIPLARILITVEIKLIAPKIEEAPARCREKIAKSTAPPLWAKVELSGG